MNRKGFRSPYNSKRTKTSSSTQNNVQDSVHRRNFRLVAMPITCIMGVLRLLALQLWIIISFLWMKLPKSRDIESDSSSVETELIREDTPTTQSCSNENAPSDLFSEKRPNVGAGEPALVKQKHHHRRAFEFISKALKLDEEDEGEI